MISFLYRCLQIIRNVRVRCVDLWQSDKSLRIFSAILQKNFKFLLWRWRKQFFSIYALSWHHPVVLLFVCVCQDLLSFLFWKKKRKNKKIIFILIQIKMLRGCGTWRVIEGFDQITLVPLLVLVCEFVYKHKSISTLIIDDRWPSQNKAINRRETKKNWPVPRKFPSQLMFSCAFSQPINIYNI